MCKLAADINECFGPGAACRNGRCTNSLGSFTCECPTGYVLSYDGRDCRGNATTTVVVVSSSNRCSSKLSRCSSDSRSSSSSDHVVHCSSVISLMT